uniref:Uncharacterized protein n=1 Tax=Knipowitschia caucasica TaxID=637954 RepID=A0AAV2KXX3_KNICA
MDRAVASMNARKARCPACRSAHQDHAARWTCARTSMTKHHLRLPKTRTVMTLGSRTRGADITAVQPRGQSRGHVHVHAHSSHQHQERSSPRVQRSGAVRRQDRS